MPAEPSRWCPPTWDARPDRRSAYLLERIEELQAQMMAGVFTGSLVACRSIGECLAQWLYFEAVVKAGRHAGKIPTTFDAFVSGLEHYMKELESAGAGSRIRRHVPREVRLQFRVVQQLGNAGAHPYF